MTIGAVAAPTWFETTTVTGVTVETSGDIAVQNTGGTATGGSISLTDDIVAAGSAYLETDKSGATINATGGGDIDLAGGNVSLLAGSGVGSAATPILVSDPDALTLAGASGANGWFVNVSSPGFFGAAATIGTVTPPAFFTTTPVTGITVSSSGTLVLENAGGLFTGGSILLADAISLSGGSGTVVLDAAGFSAQIVASGGTIELSGDSLLLVANAGIGAAGAPVEISDSSALTLAGTTETGGFYASVSSPVAAGAAVTLGAVDGNGLEVFGVTTVASGDVALKNAGGTSTGGSIMLADAIDAAGSVFLETDKPGATIVKSSSAGTIDLAGGALSLVAKGGVGTASTPIAVSDSDALTLAGAATSGGWYVSASSPAAAGAAVTIGTVTPPAFFATTPVAGIAVTSADLALQNAGGAAIGGSIVLANDASAGGNVFLEADGTGSTIASTGGTIGLSGGTLSLFATGGIGTSTSGILVSGIAALTLAAETNVGGVYLAASDAAGVTVGHAAATPSFFANGADGLLSLASSTSGDVALQNTTGSIALATAIDLAAAPGSVYLEADGASARIAASGGAIDLAGGGLSLVAGAGVGTASAPVRVADASPLTIAGATGTGGWYVSVSSPSAAGAAVTIGALTPPAFFATTPVTGVTVATSGDVAVQNLGGTATGGSIVLGNGIDLSGDAGGNVFLEADGTGATIAAGGGTIELDGTDLALVAQGGIGTSIAPILTSDAGAMTIAASTLSGGMFLSDASPVAGGATVTVGAVTTPGFFMTPLVTGLSSPNGGNVTLANVGGSLTGGGLVLADSITLSPATGALTLAATGPITQTGGTITANLLSVSAGGSATFAMGNSIANLGAITLTAGDDGDFVLQNDGNLALVGDASVVDGSIAIATTGVMTVPGGVEYSSIGHVGLGSTSFNEAGGFTVAGAPAVIIDVTGLTAMQLDAITATSASEAVGLPLGPGIGGAVVNFGALNAAGSVLLISAENADVNGTVAVGGLGVSGNGDTIDLFGSIAGVSNEFAAILAVRAQGPDNDDRFNSCAIGSPACVVEPILVPVIPPSLNNVDFLALPVPLDPLDIDRLDTGNEDDL